MKGRMRTKCRPAAGWLRLQAGSLSPCPTLSRQFTAPPPLAPHPEHLQSHRVPQCTCPAGRPCLLGQSIWTFVSLLGIWGEGGRHSPWVWARSGEEARQLPGQDARANKKLQRQLGYLGSGNLEVLLGARALGETLGDTGKIERGGRSPSRSIEFSYGVGCAHLFIQLWNPALLCAKLCGRQRQSLCPGCS